MEWCKLYASLPRDRDLRRAGEAATLLFVFGLCYVADEETDGFIDDDALPDFRLPRVTQRADALVRVGVWDRVSDGYVIPGWKEKQKELYAIMEKRRKDADRIARKRKESRGVARQDGDSSRDSRATVDNTVDNSAANGYATPNLHDPTPNPFSIMGSQDGVAVVTPSDNGWSPHESVSDSRATRRGKVAVESREEKNPPNPPAPQGGTRCADHKRPRRGCRDCALPPLAPVPDKCPDCSPARRIEADDGSDLGPCPRCHPSVVRSAS